MANELQLTPRQVNYGLKGLRSWLAQRDIILSATPGVGAELICSAEMSQALIDELSSGDRIQLVLSIEQRQQLIALSLLVVDEPIILYQLQQGAQLSRTTVLKDLDVIAEWLKQSGLKLDRRPNYGIEVTGLEQLKRQAIAALLWGRTVLGKPITKIDYANGLTFDMGLDAELLPVVKGASNAIQKWDLERAFYFVTYAETQLGGRFSDEAVLYLALIMAIQAERILSGHLVNEIDTEVLSWLQTLNIWPTSAYIARNIGRQVGRNWPEYEIALVAMHLLTAPRNERWPDDLEIDESFGGLVDELTQYIANAYGLPALAHDKTLRDGLVTHIVPTSLRHRFKIWAPLDFSETELPQSYTFERGLAFEIAKVVEQQVGVALPVNESNNIALVLRAAYIRERPNRLQEVIVVCPSGMATAQLLVARLKARFPRIGDFRVVSLREIDRENPETVQLVITTVPLPTPSAEKMNNVIQVHPLLLPEDIEIITNWLAKSHY
ncbi:MAG: PRD domain-containing protein [Candidatus Promineifilaceae bacterium]|nr:PRD domain-containing protein [Candidatus Promineifilaceae bacterium]